MTDVDVSTERVRGAATGQRNAPLTPDQFDRWLTAVSAAVRREARRQAADEIDYARRLHEPGYYPQTREGDISFGTDEGLRRAVVIARGTEVTR